MHRIFKENIEKQGNTIFVEGEDYHHIKNVLRLKAGNKIEVVIDKKLYICEISLIQDKNIELTIINECNNNWSNLNIHLYQGMSKGDKLEFIIQKSVELGVNEITPLITKRVIVKVKDKSIDKKIERYNKISKQAASQSHRYEVPKVNYPLEINKLTLEKDELGLIAYENSEEKNLKNILTNSKFENIKIVIGPEGGFEEREVEFLEERGFKIISLGPRILRTETAPLNILSIIQYEIGDLN